MKRIYKGTHIPGVGMENFTFLEEAKKEMGKIDTRGILLVDFTSVIALSSYLFNSISNPQLKVIPP